MIPVAGAVASLLSVSLIGALTLVAAWNAFKGLVQS